jgi:AcrR family transcriptional regulator
MKAKIKQSPKMPAEKRRHQLLAAARKLFVKKGYRGTTTDEIARKAHLTKGALYYHFKSKEEMLLSLVHDSNCEYAEIMAQVCRQGATPLDLLTALFSMHQREDMADFRNTIDLWVQAIRIPRIKRRLDAFIDEATTAVTESLAPDYGSDAATRQQLAIMVLALYDGLAVRKMLNPKLVDIPTQLQLFAKFQESLAGKQTAKKEKQ